MDILTKFIQKGKDSNAKIGIGLAQSNLFNKNIKDAIINFFNSNSNNIILYGTHKAIEEFLRHEPYENQHLTFKKLNNPEIEILNDVKSNNLGAVIRGSFKSDIFIKGIKDAWAIAETRRIALLETYKKEQFFFGPVGIDEYTTLESKISFINSVINQLNNLRIKPRISILSGGRLSDIGRNILVDQSIEEAHHIVTHFKEKYPKLDISHDEILIENAIANRSNLIIAPNGIAGNLIYRTLVHLGGGKAYGAIYLSLNKVILDTSRVGDSSEILGALYLAKALARGN